IDYSSIHELLSLGPFIPIYGCTPLRVYSLWFPHLLIMGCFSMGVHNALISINSPFSTTIIAMVFHKKDFIRRGLNFYQVVG
ncbi:hypothetical protein L9F63_023984, partial [Diploptera punctata]